MKILRKYFTFICALIIIQNFDTTICEFYSSIYEMSKVFRLEQHLVGQMQKFIVDNESKLDFLRARLEDYVRDQEELRAAGAEFFESPLNKYTHTKRLTVDWQLVQKIMATNMGEKALSRLQDLQNKHDMPDERDYVGAINGLLRLQYIYRLKSKELAAGRIAGIEYGTQISAQQCYDIAAVAASNDRPLLAQAWLKVALERLNAVSSADNHHLRMKAHELSLLISKKTNSSDSQGFNGTHHELLAEEQANEELANTYAEFIQVNSTKITQQMKVLDDHEPIPADLSQLDDAELYRYTCNGLIKPMPSEERQLRCGYLTETHAFLTIAPLKVEELNHDPLLVIYHDVIADEEIQIVQELMQYQMKRAAILGNNGSETSEIRVSQHAFVDKMQHKVLQTIDRRVADMTNLNMDYAEYHQIANYGIGGHYEMHTDWFSNEAFEKKIVPFESMGNRIATVLFYLSDVTQGGGTAFPHLKRLLLPKKGAAAFWYNLHASGNGDMRTIHGACPIIVGSKWVLNRWIREKNQSDRRPCRLWNDSL